MVGLKHSIKLYVQFDTYVLHSSYYLFNVDKIATCIHIIGNNYLLFVYSLQLQVTSLKSAC